MKSIVIVGAGGFGREVAWLIERINFIQKQFNILGFIDDNHDIGEVIGNYNVIGNINDLNKYDEDLNIAIAIGNSQARKKVFSQISRFNKFVFPNLIDPTSIVNSTKLGIGNIICANNIFTVDYKLEDFNIVNLMCTIGHDVIFGSFITVYPGVNISGNVNCKECIEVGTGTKIIQGLNISENSIIGAGTIVINDIEKNCTVVGVPGKVIKRGNKNE